MWRATHSLLYYMESEWMPVFPFGEIWLAGGSQQPQARHFANKLWYGPSHEPLTQFWQSLTQKWLSQRPKTTPKWSKWRRKEYRSDWPRFTTWWRYGMAGRTNVLPSRNFATNTRRWASLITFRTPKRSSKYPGHSFQMMVQLHLNCQKDHLGHQLCVQSTSLEDELKYEVFAQSGESTLIQSNMMRIAHLNVIRTPKICSTATVV